MMRKKCLISIFIATAMSILLVGCGNKNNSTPAGTDSNLEDLLNPTKENNNETTGYPVTPPGEPGYSGPTDAVETPTEKEDKPSEGGALKDGPVNPTHRKMYLMDSTMYNGFIDGTYPLEKVEAFYKENGVAISEEKIEYTDNGYVVYMTAMDMDDSAAVDTVTTYNDRGEMVHITRTRFDSKNPDGKVILEADYVQEHFNGGIENGTEYVAGIEVDSKGRISSINEILSYNNGHNSCNIYGKDMAVLNEKNRTIIYDATTCDVYNLETRENFTALKTAKFEMITYNSEGKIEAIYYNSHSEKLENGKDENGKSFVDIRDYIEYLIENDTIKLTASWTYDKNGNVLSKYNDGIYTVYIYE